MRPNNFGTLLPPLIRRHRESKRVGPISANADSSNSLLECTDYDRPVGCSRWSLNHANVATSAESAYAPTNTCGAPSRVTSLTQRPKGSEFCCRSFAYTDHRRRTRRHTAFADSSNSLLESATEVPRSPGARLAREAHGLRS